MNYSIFILSFLAFQASSSLAQTIATIFQNTMNCINKELDSLNPIEEALFLTFMATLDTLVRAEDEVVDCLEHVGDPPLYSEAVRTAECVGNVIVDPPQTEVQKDLYTDMNFLFQFLTNFVPTLSSCSQP